MDSDHEEDVNTMVTELEVAEEIEEEEQMEVEAIPLDEFSMETLRKLPSPRSTKSRSDNKSLCMDQMTLLQKMDKNRLKENPIDDQDFNAHECEHCKKLLIFTWKTKEKLHSRPTNGLGSCHTAHVQRRLGKWCNAEGRASIAQRTNEKIRIKEQHEEEVTAKAEKHQQDVALGSERKRGGGNQQKMNCTLSHQDK